MTKHYRVMWNYGGIWQVCEPVEFKSYERAAKAAIECEKQGGAPHRIWEVTRVIDPRVKK